MAFAVPLVDMAADVLPDSTPEERAGTARVLAA